MDIMNLHSTRFIYFHCNVLYSINGRGGILTCMPEWTLPSKGGVVADWTTRP